MYGGGEADNIAGITDMVETGGFRLVGHMGGGRGGGGGGGGGGRTEGRDVNGERDRIMTQTGKYTT